MFNVFILHSIVKFISIEIFFNYVFLLILATPVTDCPSDIQPVNKVQNERNALIWCHVLRSA